MCCQKALVCVCTVSRLPIDAVFRETSRTWLFLFLNPFPGRCRLVWVACSASFSAAVAFYEVHWKLSHHHVCSHSAWSFFLFLANHLFLRGKRITCWSAPSWMWSSSILCFYLLTVLFCSCQTNWALHETDILLILTYLKNRADFLSITYFVFFNTNTPKLTNWSFTVTALR